MLSYSISRVFHIFAYRISTCYLVKLCQQAAHRQNPSPQGKCRIPRGIQVTQYEIFPLSKRQTPISIASFHQVRHMKHVSEVINILSGFSFGRR